jgi:hypothetical protein
MDDFKTQHLDRKGSKPFTLNLKKKWFTKLKRISSRIGFYKFGKLKVEFRSSQSWNLITKS